MSLKTENSRRVAKSRPVCMGLMCVKTARFTPLISLKFHRPQRLYVLIVDDSGRVRACCGRGYFAGLRVTKRTQVPEVYNNKPLVESGN